MTLFQEIEEQASGEIVAVEPGSVADEIGLQPGDWLLAINDHAVEDVIDVQFYAAEEQLELLVRRGEELLLFEAIRAYNQPLGLEFSHPTFDIDIRRCNNLCEFCFVLQMAPKFRRTLYIKDDDYRYSFLFGHYVTLTNLSDHDWWRIEHMGLSPLYVSVHVTDLEMRRRFLRNENAPDIMEQLRWLAERGIEVHTQLVIVPEFNDGKWLERSIEELATLWPAVQSVSVVPVGLTKQHKYGMRPHTVAEAGAMLEYVAGVQPRFQEQFDCRFVYPSDEWFLKTGQTVPPLKYYEGQALQENGLGMVRRFLDEWHEVQNEMATAGVTPEVQHVTLATGRMFEETLREAAALFAAQTGLKVDVVAVNNEKFGGTITTAGLLMARDVLEQLGERELGEMVVLPRVMFDHPDVITLDDRTPQDCANVLDRPVALADTMGDVWDAVTGQSQVTFYPGRSGDDATLGLRVLNDDDLDPSNHVT